MAKCKACGGGSFARKVLTKYHDDLMGIPIIVVDAVGEESCNNCGKVRGHLIPNLEGLISAVAVKRAMITAKLAGHELRFMRQALGWKAKELAQRLKVTPECVSVWEHDQRPINAQSELYLRLVVCTLLGEKAPRIKWDPNKIVGMKIRSVRAIGPRVPLCFRLVREATEAEEPTKRESKVHEQYQAQAA